MPVLVSPGLRPMYQTADLRLYRIQLRYVASCLWRLTLQRLQSAALSRHETCPVPKLRRRVDASAMRTRPALHGKLRISKRRFRSQVPYSNKSPDSVRPDKDWAE